LSQKSAAAGPVDGIDVADPIGMKPLAPTLSLLLMLPCFASTVFAQDPSIYTIVSELRRQSHADALTIKEEYRPLAEATMFEDEEALRRAIDAGELVPLSSVDLVHLQPRLWGHSPIAERDLENQSLYVALRPPAFGMLIDISRRVTQGPVELTSAVRTTKYQRALMRGNSNANTDVPTHVMGYAIDIGLKFASEDTAKDLRRVLDEMRDAGDIYFIAERNQLTFHVVPVPSRFEHFEAVYEEALAAAQPPPPAVVAPAPVTTEEEFTPFADLWSWITGLFG
jgi:hypothetical protein